MKQDQFEWIPFFEAIADGLLRHKDDRTALVGAFHKIAKSDEYRRGGSEIVYRDRYKDGTRGDLKDIDPFTVMGLFLRVKHEKRIYAITKLADFLKVDVNIPNSFAGVPHLRPDKCWFFAFEKNRGDGDIDFHWDLLEKAINFANNENNDDAKKAFIAAFDESLNVKQVGVSYLTMGLFWIRPNFFPVLNTPVSNYIKHTWNISINPEINGEEYLKIRENLMQGTSRPFPEISHDAYWSPESRDTAQAQEQTNTYNEQTNITNTKTKIPLNQIFYGPPGTGKTYNTIDKAIHIIDGEPSNPDKKLTSNERKNRFQVLQKTGQIELVTFHQNYAYEDFIEGIKPKLDEKNISYEIKEGIFRNIAKRANDNREDSEKAHTATNVRELIEEYAAHIEEQMSDNQTIYLDKKGEKTPVIQQVKYTPTGDLRSFLLLINNNSTQFLTLDVVVRDYQNFVNKKIKTFKDVRPTFESQRSFHGNARYYLFLYERIQEYAKQFKIELHKQKIERKNYVLIIDEINRGNISKIFGELITLVEESKRLGKEHELSLTLPYSNEPFGVPDNLYIIGTMNTADRSIALLDTALRRRFNFIEMMPDANKLKEIYGVSLPKLLTAINENITALYDREHQIGHTYLMDVNTIEDLKDAFQQKIIPLLQEYFFDDREKIDQVLNENGFIISYEYRKGSIKIFDLLAKDSEQWNNANLYIKIYDEQGNASD